MENLKSSMNQLLTREVDRREFLKISGVLVLSAIGLGRILRLLNVHSSSKQDFDNGWGHNSYGGPRR